MSQADDMNAINAYMMATAAVTTAATALKNDWVTWWNNLGMFGIYEQGNYDEARNRRTAFNLANATSPAEVAQVQAVATGGLSTEQQQGLPDRRDSNGMLPVTPPPLIPTEYKVFAGIALFLLAAVVVVKKV